MIMTTNGVMLFVLIHGFVLLSAWNAVYAQSFAYLGCWSDPATNTQRDISGFSRTVRSGLTVDSCVKVCSGIFPYVGLQAGTKCYCGLTYGTHGNEDANCNFTCKTKECGGVEENSVYYSADSDLASQRIVNVRVSSVQFNKARSTCLFAGGDLTTAESADKISAILSLLPQNGTSSITSLWIGLWRRVGSNYEWTSPSVVPSYAAGLSTYRPLWTANDEQKFNCVSLDVGTKLLKSTDCTKSLPFVCDELPGSDTGTVAPTEASPGGISDESKRLALFIVLPLFLCCYGGSCIIYCIHKLVRNCAKARRIQVPESDPVKPMHPSQPVMVQPMMAGPGMGAREKQPVPPMMLLQPPGPPKSARPWSGKRSASVSPAPPENMPPPSFLAPTEPRRPITPVQEMKTKSDDPADISMKPLSAQPPPYADREEARRAKLLENAAREARERKQQRDPSSRPGTGTSVDPPTSSPEPKDADTAQLLPETSGGRPGADPTPSDRATPQGLAGMSINDILKMKMAQKSGDGKKKQRKIISS